MFQVWFQVLVQETIQVVFVQLLFQREIQVCIFLISILNLILPQRMSQGFIQVPIQVFLQNLPNFHIIIVITIHASMFIQVASQVLVQRLVQ